MKLLSWPAGASPLTHDTAGAESGDPEPLSAHRAGIATLDQRVEFMRWCVVCDCMQMFVAGWECAHGLVGCCLGCGQERVAPWTRSVAS